jgi:hypothetical protein
VNAPISNVVSQSQLHNQSQPSQVLSQQQLLQNNQNQIKSELPLTIQTINETSHDLTLPSHTTCLELKKHIHAFLCSSLEVNHMSLTYMGSVLNNKLKLSEINLAT